jgi:hypothetical protein
MKIVAVQFDYDSKNKYGRLLSVFEKSVQKNWPEVGLEIIKIPPPASVSRRHHSFTSNHEKFKIWMDAVENANEPVILMDCDMLVRAPFGEVFDQDFDVALTVRNNRLRYNGGVVFVKPTQAGKDFIRAWAESDALLYSDPKEHEQWRRKYAGMNQAALGRVIELGLHKAKILEVPCSKYNCCLDDFTNIRYSDPESVKVIHYKSGLRKSVLAGRGPQYVPEHERIPCILWWEFEGKTFENVQDPDPGLLEPRTYREHIQHKKIFQRDPLITLTSDKVRVRQFVRNKGFEEILVPVLFNTSDPGKIKWRNVEGNYAVKMNNASGRNIFSFPGHKLNKTDIIKFWNRWHDKNYGGVKGEWGYQDIKPQMICEKLLYTDGQWADCYRVDTFAGKPEYVQRYTFGWNGKKLESKTVTTYSKEWELLDVTWNEKPREPTDKPEFLPKMLEMASKLGEDFDYVRVDFLVHEGKIYFSELTHYPLSGRGRIPEWFDVEMGKKWRDIYGTV